MRGHAIPRVNAESGFALRKTIAMLTCGFYIQKCYTIKQFYY
jgi:hypothetical protein